MNTDHSFPCVALALLVALSAGTVSAASRTGEFTPWNAWWLHPTQGTLGIRFEPLTNAIQIDRDGDGTTESSFVRPTGPEGIGDAAIGSLRLTPSRTIVYSFGGICGGTGGTLVSFHRVPASGTRLEPIRTGLCIPRGIDRVGFYDTGRCDEPNGIGLGLDCTTNQRLGVSPQRIAYFATPAAAFGNENFIWVDLETGITSTATAFNFTTGLGFVQVSPSGTQAFIQHSLSTSDSGADYRLVDLCPGSLGTVINMGGFPIVDVDDVLSAEVTAASGGMVTIEVTPTTPTASFDLVDCLDAPGACCGDFSCAGDQITATLCSTFTGYDFLGPGTACSECPEPLVLEACCFESGEPYCERRDAAQCTAQGGDPQAGVRFCAANTCPVPNPTLSISGPASAGVGDTVTLELDYENTGGLTAPDVEIEFSLPYGTTFEGASNGGDEQDGYVRWVIGDLAPGAGGTVSVSFTIGCLAASQSAYLQGSITYPYSIEGNRIYYPSNLILLEVGAAASGPLTLSVTGTPTGDPLLPGDEVEHTITLTNANPDLIPGVRIGRADSFVPMGLSYGTAMSFDRVVDAAGGVVDTSGGDFEWSGDVPANTSRTIRFVTAVDACVPPSSETTSLHFGGAVAAFDQCDTKLGESGSPPEFALGHLADVSIAATNLAPPKNLKAPIFDIDVQVARPGATVEMVVSIASTAGQATPGASVSAFVRGIDVTMPPSEPGASYNALTREFAWTGTIPASGSVDVHFAGTLTACRGEVDLDGATSPECLATPDIRAQTTIAAVPEPPAGLWLAALAQRSGPFSSFTIEDHLVQIDPGPPVRTITMMCLPAEYSTGIGASPEGDVWVGSLPTYRVNPRRLEFQPFDRDRHVAAGLTSLESIAVDPVDGSVYMSGYAYEPMNGSAAAKILRYDPMADALEPFYDDSSFSSIGEIAVDGDGSVAAIAYAGAQNALVRIDPGAPADEAVLYDPPSSVLTDVAIDRDGSYVVLDGFYGTTPTVYDVDPDTGDRTTLVADLRVPFPAALAWGQLEVAASGDLFLAPWQPGLGRIRRATPDVGEILQSFSAHAGSLTDLAMVGLPIPEPGATALAAAALSALAALGRRRRIGSVHDLVAHETKPARRSQNQNAASVPIA